MEADNKYTEERVFQSFKAGMLLMAGIFFILFPMMNWTVGLHFGNAGLADYIISLVVGIILTLFGGFLGWFYNKPCRI